MRRIYLRNGAVMLAGAGFCAWQEVWVVAAFAGVQAAFWGFLAARWKEFP